MTGEVRCFDVLYCSTQFWRIYHKKYTLKTKVPFKYFLSPYLSVFYDEDYVVKK